MASKANQAIEWDVFKPRNWGQSTKAHALKRPWFGLDTERDAKDGEFVCGFYVSPTDEYRFETMQDLVPGTYWVWNLAYDAEGMLRDMGVDEAWAAKKDAAQFKLLGGRARYFHGKRFDWMKPGEGKVVMLEASSFWGRVPLKSIGAKDPVDASKMSKERYDSDPVYRQTVDRYCVQDARIVVENVERLGEGVRGLGVAMGGTPGATARRFLSRLPTFSPVAWEGHKAFLRSYCGGRFEVAKRGVFPTAYQYDIKSAYPWALSQCPWLTGTAKQRLTRRLDDEALYGSYLVSFETDEYLGIAPGWVDGVRVYTNAQDKTWVTLPELRWLQENGYDYTIHRGVDIVDENAGPHWADVIRELYQIKAEHRDAPLGKAAKIVLNSMYGVLIQLVPKSGKWVPLLEATEQGLEAQDFAGDLAFIGGPKAFEAGQYYSPVYAGHLTALTRVKLLDVARMAGEHYIGGHTDSVLTMKEMHLPTDELGDWDLEAYTDRYVRQTIGKDALPILDFSGTGTQVSKTGMYAMGNKVKMRGITRDGGAEMLWAEEHERNQRMGIKRATRWEDVSVINPTRVKNNYQIERKRKWEQEFDLSVVERGEYIDSKALCYV